MTWKGLELRTVGEVYDAALSLVKSKAEAEEFITLYRSECASADENLGYMSGYYGPTERKKLRELYGISHPIFGDYEPSPDDAFLLGKYWAEGKHYDLLDDD